MGNPASMFMNIEAGLIFLQINYEVDKMKKKMALILGMLVMVGSIFVGCGNSSKVNSDGMVIEPNSIAAIKEKGKLVMGTSADFPPNEFHIMVDGKDTIVGFDIEIGKYIAEKLGVELEIRDMEFNNLLGGLSTGMLDIVISGMVEKPDRDANFTKPYDIGGIHKILIRKSDKDKYLSKEDLKGAVIGAQTASIQKEMAENIEGAEVRELPLINTLIMELKTEKIDALVMSNETSSSYAEANDDIMVIESIELKHESSGASIALKTGNDNLTDYINGIVDELIEKGLVEEWKAEAKALSDQEIK